MNMTTDRTHLPFDLSTSAALHTAAQQMQGSSPFAAAVTDLQLPRIALSALRRLAEVQATTPLGGRFVRWELCGAELWLGCALDQLDTGLAAGLPSCRVGSVEGIEVAQRVEFLAAVVAAFPLTDASTFHCRLPDAEQVLLAAAAAAAAAAPVAAPAAALAKAASKPHTAVAAKREVKREVMLVAAKAKSAAPCRNYSRGTCKNGAACRFVHVEAKTGAKTARMVRVGKLAPSRGQDCGLAPMDVATGVTGEAKIHKRRPRASRGRVKGF